MEVTNCFSVPHNESEDEVSGCLSCHCVVCSCSFARLSLRLPLPPAQHVELITRSSTVQRAFFLCVHTCGASFVSWGWLLVLSFCFFLWTSGFLASFSACLLRWLLTWNLLRTCMNYTRKSLQMSSSLAGKSEWGDGKFR